MSAPWWNNVEYYGPAVVCVRCSATNQLRMVGEQAFCRDVDTCDRNLRELRVKPRVQHPDRYLFEQTRRVR